MANTVWQSAQPYAGLLGPLNTGEHQMVRSQAGVTLVLVGCFALAQVAMPSPATASTEGCPDTWVNPDLAAARQRLGGNMVETVLGTTVVKYESLDGASHPDKNILTVSGTVRSILSYLYGKSIIATQVRVEVKNCPKPGVFSFNSNYSDSGRRVVEVVRMTAADFAAKNPQAFRDFKKQESFPAALAQATTRAQIIANKYRDGRKVPPNFSSSLFPVGVFPADLSLPNIVSLTPYCIGPSDPRLRGYVQVNFGGKCEFAWFTSEGVDENDLDPNSQLRFVLIEPFTLDLTPTRATITCIKGKITKKVSGTRPKCPAGFKKK
jgi:hypothetical protein